MKIRQGFVSNSSSSNFVLAFKKKPESIDELKKLMFGDLDIFHYDNETATTHQIAEAVFRQLGDELSLDMIIEEFTSGWLEGINDDFDSLNNMPEMFIEDENGNNQYNPEYERYAEAKREKTIIRALEFFNNWKCPDDQKFFVVEFADDDGSFGGLCEHGGIFNKIHHVQISHH